MKMDNKNKGFFYSLPNTQIEAHIKIMERMNDFSMKLYGDVLVSLANEYVKQLPLKSRDLFTINNIYTWWLIFNEPLSARHLTIFQLFCRKYLTKNSSRNVRFILSRWFEVEPGLFYINKIRDSKISVIDFLDEERSKIIYLADSLNVTKSNCLFTGILLPLGNGSYMNLSELYMIQKPFNFEDFKSLSLSKLKKADRLKMLHYPAILKRLLNHVFERNKHISKNQF